MNVITLSNDASGLSRVARHRVILYYESSPASGGQPLREQHKQEELAIEGEVEVTE